MLQKRKVTLVKLSFVVHIPVYSVISFVCIVKIYSGYNDY